MLDNNFDFVDEFERKLAEYTQFHHAVCVDCCTNAILLSLEVKSRLGEISKEDTLVIPKNTYLSVPMTLKNNGWKISFELVEWSDSYQIGKGTGVFDAAVGFDEQMAFGGFNVEDFLVCVSFQQKKRLSLGRGGAILFNSGRYLDLLRRMRHDGRDPKIHFITESTMTPKDIVMGYHCYMEPERAALGICKLNQSHLLPPYRKIGYDEYPDISILPVWS